MNTGLIDGTNFTCVNWQMHVAKLHVSTVPLLWSSQSEFLSHPPHIRHSTALPLFNQSEDFIVSKSNSPDYGKEWAKPYLSMASSLIE
jgi:hypothetical protein